MMAREALTSPPILVAAVTALRVEGLRVLLSCTATTRVEALRLPAADARILESGLDRRESMPGHWLGPRVGERYTVHLL